MHKPDSGKTKSHHLLAYAGLGVMGLCLLAYAGLTRHYEHIHTLSALPLWELTPWLLGAGLAYLILCRVIQQNRISSRTMAVFLLAGLFLRLALFASAPILENDHYRFRWDGAVLAHGCNPYAYAPSVAIRGAQKEAPAQLADLGEQAGLVLQRVGYPYLRTIYPPLSQAAFALGHLIGGFSLWSWRLVLLLADLATLLFIAKILKHWSLPQKWIGLYWLNPILLHEIYAVCHMEVLLFPPLLGAMFMAGKGRSLAASALLGVGVGIKLWPALLLPLVLRIELKRPLRLMAGAALFGALAGLMLLPMVLSGLGDDSGLRAYSQRWEMNDAAFLLLMQLSRGLATALGLNWQASGLLARGLCVLLVLGWLAWLCRKPLMGPAWADAFLGVSAALFLLSPTQFPWYALWLLPFLTLRPNWAFLILALTLPLYYLRPWFGAQGWVQWFDWGLVWLEFGPVWLLLIWQARRGKGAWEALA